MEPRRNAGRDIEDPDIGGTGAAVPDVHGDSRPIGRDPQALHDGRLAELPEFLSLPVEPDESGWTQGCLISEDTCSGYGEGGVARSGVVLDVQSEQTRLSFQQRLALIEWLREERAVADIDQVSGRGILDP